MNSSLGNENNSKAVWVQLTLTLALFFVLPLALPAVAPGLKSNSYLTKRTDQVVVENTYRAAKVEDVTWRARHQSLATLGTVTGQSETAGPSRKVQSFPF